MESNPYSAPVASPEASRGYDAGASGITDGIVDQLARTKPWVRFISVLMFIGSGFMLLGGLVMGLGGGIGMMAARSMGGAEVGLGLGMLLFYALLAVLYIYPAIKLWCYGSRIAALVNSRSSIDLESVLNEQRAFWKFCGIIAIVMLALYAVAIGIFVFGAAAAAAAAQ